MEEYDMTTFDITCADMVFPADTVGGNIRVTLAGIDPVVAPVVVMIRNTDSAAEFPAVLEAGSYEVSAQLVNATGTPISEAIVSSFTTEPPTIVLKVPTGITKV
jgi:hypothetical protein